MSSDITDARFYLRTLTRVMECVRKDFKPIVAVAVALTLIGAYAGTASNRAVSTAQLLLTPLPLRAATTDDDLAKMIAEPLDVITASRLCTSDDCLRLTMERLNASGEFSRPFEDLNRLRLALSYEITITKETPYETEYSPVLQLRARGHTATTAKTMVDTWAEVCVEIAEQYRDRQQSLAVRAFLAQRGQLLDVLSEAEGEIEQFRRENNLEFVSQRLEQVVELTTEYLEQRAAITQDMIDAESRLRALQTVLEGQEPQLRLRWTPSGRLADWAADALRLESPPVEAVEADILTQEQLNPVYMNLLGEAAATQSLVDGKMARLEILETQLDELKAEMLELQVESARLRREDRRLERAAEIVEEAYKDAALKTTFARMAAELDQPGIQLLSAGAEWRVPRFRRGILFGFAGGVVGLLGAVALSAGARLVLLPAIEEQA